GRVEDKSTFIANATSGKSKFLSLAYEDVKVRVVGTTAVVRFHWVGERQSVADGKKNATNLHILMNWQRQSADWKLLSRASTKLGPPARCIFQGLLGEWPGLHLAHGLPPSPNVMATEVAAAGVLCCEPILWRGPPHQLANGWGLGFEPSVKRASRKGVGSTRGRLPITISAISQPAPGPMPKPCPENP